MTTLATLAILTAESSNRFPANHEIFVETVRDWFTVDKTSALTADGITVLTPASGPGQYRRAIGRQHPSWSVQTAWFIDPTSGSDENTGLTSGVPIKTNAELQRRWGSKVIFDVIPTITYMGAAPITDEMNFNIMVRDGGLIFKSTPTVTRSGTFSAITALNRGTQTPWAITDGTFDFTGSVNSQIWIPSGARAGARAWVAKAVSAGVARTSQFFIQPTTDGTTVPVTPQIGDAYEVRTLPQVYVGTVNFESSASANIASFLDLRLTGSRTGGSSLPAGAIMGIPYQGPNAIGCFMDNLVINSPLYGVSCRWASGIITSPGKVYVIGGLVTGSGIGIAEGGVAYIDWDVLVQGATNGIFMNMGAEARVGSIGAFDCTGTVMVVNDACKAIMSHVLSGTTLFYGTNNAANAAQVAQGSHMRIATLPTCNAGLGLGREISVGGENFLWADMPVSGTNSKSSVSLI